MSHLNVQWHTSAGKPVTWFVSEQVRKGLWREEEITPEISGLSRTITVFRASKKSDFIAYAWHGDRETFCPPMWWDLAIGSGACGLGCRACFLMLTHRIRRDPRRPLLYENIDDFTRAVEKWLQDPTRRRQHTLGVGIDRNDSLLYEGVTGHVRNLAPLFANPALNSKGNKLILLTKSANTHYLAEIRPEHRGAIVASFSLNPENVADAWEGKWDDGVRITPSIARRLQAVRYAQDLGYEVRVRVDPILTIPGWEEHYADFVEEVRAAGITFRYWTLGTYREKNLQLDSWRAYWGLPAMEWQPDETDLVQEGTHRRLSEARRREIYTTVAVLIRRLFPDARISLCKETNVLRRRLDLCNADCNCLV